MYLEVSLKKIGILRISHIVPNLKEMYGVFHILDLKCYRNSLSDARVRMAPGGYTHIYILYIFTCLCCAIAKANILVSLQFHKSLYILPTN